jgi:hypothetical protein
LSPAAGSSGEPLACSSPPAARDSRATIRRPRISPCEEEAIPPAATLIDDARDYAHCTCLSIGERTDSRLSAGQSQTRISSAVDEGSWGTHAPVVRFLDPEWPLLEVRGPFRVPKPSERLPDSGRRGFRDQTVTSRLACHQSVGTGGTLTALSVTRLRL